MKISMENQLVSGVMFYPGRNNIVCFLTGENTLTKFTSHRTLKIQEMGDFYRHKTVPEIRLKGQWLAGAGFPPNGHAEIELLEPGKIIITARSPKCPL
jgi:hypothetical protein